MRKHKMQMPIIFNRIASFQRYERELHLKASAKWLRQSSMVDFEDANDNIFEKLAGFFQNPSFAINHF